MTSLHLVDGTYELFRAFFGAPPASAPDGREVGATRGMLRTLYALATTEGATHVGVAFDHVIESFRNRLFAGYKTGDGIDPALWSQFGLVEEAAAALGMVVWPMVEFEADDAIAAAAARWRDEVDQVVICSVDKDLMQCVRGRQVVVRDRRRGITYDEPAVVEKHGVLPRSIPDYLALVGDSADGIPGIARWGAKSTAAVLRRYGQLEEIPTWAHQWDVTVRGAGTLATNLAENAEAAALYKVLATLREDVPLTESLAQLEWKGADRERLSTLCHRIGDERFLARVDRWRAPSS